MRSELEQISSRSGLPLRSQPDWRYESSSGRYAFEVCLLGDRIVVASAVGTAEVEDVERTFGSLRP